MAANKKWKPGNPPPTAFKEPNENSFTFGNQMWKLRSKSGPDAIFSDPSVMLNAAIEYFETNDANPWYKYEAIKSGDMAGQLAKIPTARPYTLWALCRFLGVNSVYFYAFRNTVTYTNNKDAYDKVLLFIAETIKAQKYEGASVGAFHAGIVMRDLGITDLATKELPQGDDDNTQGTAARTMVYLPQKGSVQDELTQQTYDDV